MLADQPLDHRHAFVMGHGGRDRSELHGRAPPGRQHGGLGFDRGAELEDSEKALLPLGYDGGGHGFGAAGKHEGAGSPTRLDEAMETQPVDGGAHHRA